VSGALAGAATSGRVQRRKVFGDAGLGVGEEFLELARIEVLIPRIDRAKLAAINGQQFPAEQIQFPTQQGKLPRHRFEGFQVVLAEICDGLEVGRQLAGQPDEFDVAVTLRLQPARGAEAVQITVKIKFEQHRGIVGRATGVGTARLGKAERGQILFRHEGVEKADGIFRGHIILEPLGQQERLRTLQTTTVFHACQTYQLT